MPGVLYFAFGAEAEMPARVKDAVGPWIWILRGASISNNGLVSIMRCQRRLVPFTALLAASREERIRSGF